MAGQALPSEQLGPQPLVKQTEEAGEITPLPQERPDQRAQGTRWFGSATLFYYACLPGLALGSGGSSVLGHSSLSNRSGLGPLSHPSASTMQDRRPCDALRVNRAVWLLWVMLLVTRAGSIWVDQSALVLGVAECQAPKDGDMPREGTCHEDHCVQW